MEYGIDLKKYFVSLIRYWWVCIIMAAVFGVALGGYKYMKDTDAVTASETSTKIESQEEISDVERRVAEAKAKFDAGELQNVELAVEYYKQLQMYNKYLESSIYVSQDPYNVSKTTLYYVVDIDSSVKKDFDEGQMLAGNIATAYANYVNGGEFLDKISDKIGVASPYISELIQAKTDNSTSPVNYFRVTFINVREIADISEYIADSINEYTADISVSLGKHTLKLVDDYTATVVDESIMSKIQSMQSDIYNASTRLVSIKKNFTTNQLSCYNDEILIVKSLNSQSVNAQLDENTNNEDIVVSSEDVSLNIQYILLGVIVGIVIYCGIVLLLQIFSPYIVSASAFQGMFGLRYLGVMNEEYLAIIAMKIQLACKSDESDKIVLFGSDSEVVSSESTDKLIEQLGKANIQVVKLDSALENENEMSELFNVGKCIFIESTGRSKVNNVAELVDFCKENKIKMYGVVDIKA